MKETLSSIFSSTGSNGFGRADYLKITIFGFALAALWASLHSIILPIRLLDFVDASQKNTYLGLLTFAGLIVAMAWQPIAGTLSDRSSFRWGRRRPFVLLGTIGAILFIPGIGFADSYVAIFVIYCLLQVCGNIAQGGYQGFIPDLVPEERRGLASGVKTLLEIVGGVALISVIGRLMDNYFAGEGESWLWLSLGLPAILLLVTMTATLLMVKEQAGTGGPKLSLPSILRKTFKIDVEARSVFVRFLVSRLLFFMALATLQTFTLYFIQDVVGLENPAEAAANLLVVIGICMIVTVYPAGRLSDKVGRRPIAISSGLLGAVATLLIFFSPTYQYVMVCGSFLGISAGAFMSTNWAMAIDLVPKGEEARYLGLTNIATAGGAAIARLIGPVIDFFNSISPAMGYKAMLLACCIYLLVSAVLLLKVKVR